MERTDSETMVTALRPAAETERTDEEEMVATLRRAKEAVDSLILLSARLRKLHLACVRARGAWKAADNDKHIVSQDDHGVLKNALAAAHDHVLIALKDVERVVRHLGVSVYIGGVTADMGD